MSKPLLIIIGADKGGVGKTTVARAVCDYLNAAKINHRAFDSEVPKGVLARFFPRSTEIVDLSITDGQMKIFDTLSPDTATVIDVCAGMLTSTLKTLATVGLLDLVKAGTVELVVMHVIGASVASFAEVKETAAIIAGAKHILVRNHINDSAFFEWDASAADVIKSSGADAVIDIPQLETRANEDIDSAGVPFRTYAANEKSNGEPGGYSFVLRGLTKAWLGQIFPEFDRAGLNKIAIEARS